LRTSTRTEIRHDSRAECRGECSYRRADLVCRFSVGRDRSITYLQGVGGECSYRRAGLVCRFIFNVGRVLVLIDPPALMRFAAHPTARGLRSFTFRLNLSTFCGIRWVHGFPPLYETGGHEKITETAQVELKRRRV